MEARNGFDAALIDLYDTVADGAWGDLAQAVMERAGVNRVALWRAFDLTRPARSVGAFGSAEGDLAAVISACGVEPDPDVVSELAALELAVLPARARLYDDSLPVVRELRERGVRVALVSNCSYSTRPVVDALGLPAEFDAVVLSFEVGAAKPDAEIYREALSMLDEPEPERTVFVDDQARYCDGASAIGLQTRLIDREDADPIEGLAADDHGHITIRDLRSLLD